MDSWNTSAEPSSRNTQTGRSQEMGAKRGFTRNTTFYVEKIRKILDKNKLRMKRERVVKRKEELGEYEDNKRHRE